MNYLEHVNKYLETYIEPEPVAAPAAPKKINLYQDAKIEDFPNISTDLIQDIYQRKFVSISGMVGRGKTYLAHAIGNYFKLHTLCINAPALKQKLCDFVSLNDFSQSTMYKNAAYLIIDDLGKENTTEFFNGFLFELLEYRINNMKLTTITTNLQSDGLDERYFTGLCSRMLAGVIIKLNGIDRRAQNIRKYEL